ncbi:serine hydrolase domain-containing protein [Nocardia sp. NPDC051756]|uniref:serine hydrolase domain-containing protein n=1 Tax=Nocardia sp. NPDC051756 TaxID=3154751 RepID=UPI003426B23D
MNSVRRVLISLSACLLVACSTDRTTTEPVEIPMDAVTQATEKLTRDNGVPGAQATLTSGAQQRLVNSGVGDRATGAPFPDNAHLRIGSNTKTFVATVAMQLAAEGRLELDAPVTRYLPAVFDSAATRPAGLTVRQLMQHMSGLPDYTENPELDAESARYRVFEPRYLVDLALRSAPAHFEPGARWEYSNTNYLVVGMIIEQITGTSIAEAVHERIVAPLGLQATRFPAPGESGLDDPHPVGYALADGQAFDYTDFEPSWAGAAGAMVSTAAELNRFFLALLAGRLVPPPQLAEMQHTVPADEMSPGFRYGLGIARIPVSCGREVWGHGGSILGFRTRGGATTDGDAVTVTVNAHPSNGGAATDMLAVVDAALCPAKKAG